MRRPPRPISTICGRGSTRKSRSRGSQIGRCWPCKDRWRPRSWRVWRLRPWDWRLWAPSKCRSPVKNAWSRDRAIPARTGSRFRCRQRAQRHWPSGSSPSPMWRPPASAPAIHCALRPGCASTARTSTPPSHRSRPTFPGPSPPGAAGPAGFRERRLCSTNSPTVPGARGHPDPRHGRRADRSGHQRRFRPLARCADRHGLCRSRSCCSG